MANLSGMTRKEAVLELLRSAQEDRGRDSGWVTTAEINSKEVGGTEGTRRLRDLRADGYIIEKRKHPDPAVDQFQYRLAGRYEPPQPKLIGRVTSKEESGGVVMDDLDTRDGLPPRDLPWVSWRPGRSGSMTAKHAGWDLWVAPAMNNTWVWRAAGPPEGRIGIGHAPTLADAKRAAVTAIGGING
jgi:hypothetical protein